MSTLMVQPRTFRLCVGTTQGAWAQLEDGAFGMTRIGFAFDDPGKFLATQRVHLSVELTDSGWVHALRGRDFLKADGHVLASISGTIQGKRIDADRPG